MNEFKRLSEVFESSEEIFFDDSSKFIFMSDCHRGDGSWADSFRKNRNNYYAALTHYYNNNYTYIELGDGDELWENDEMNEIISQHGDVFILLSKFVDEDRLHFIYGNHDMIKKKFGSNKNSNLRYFDESDRRNIHLFEHIKVHEGLVLRHSETGDKIFLVHGHQMDFLNDRLWWLSRFLVRYLWRPLELLGVNDPTSTSRNYHKKASIEWKLMEWVKRNKHMLIAGHTHRPVFPEPGQVPYFNDGSCVHPNGITGIEITEGWITLVRWSTKTREDGTLYVGREELKEPRKLKDYFRV
jgi:UDP-2,3-diacylglucosamine pyrophosphatase LpxH